ncbi:hypothetical protein LDENG_00195070, partial [Lucifuga dentata]
MHQIQITRILIPLRIPSTKWSSNLRDPDHCLRLDRNCSWCVGQDLNTEPYQSMGTSPSPTEATQPGGTPQMERHPGRRAPGGQRRTRRTDEPRSQEGHLCAQSRQVDHWKSRPDTH